ncbi:MAG TPA: hypothetical protein ENH82_18525 [bacterium]|nr:hypothetical protein [bacterium]
MNEQLMTPNQTALVEIRNEIETHRERFDKYPHSGRVIDSYLIYLSLNYDLLKCTPNSLVKCLLEAVILKLDFTKSKGQLCIIAYKNLAELMVEYRGFVDVILRNNKDVAYVDGKAVYEGDHVEISNDRINHILCPFGKDRGKMIGVYAKAVYKAGGERNVVLYADDIQKIRACAPQKYVWDKWPDQMAIKSAVRRLCKLFPMSEDLSNVIESLDRQTELGQAEPPLPLDESMAIKMQEAGLETEGETPIDVVIDSAAAELPESGDSVTQPGGLDRASLEKDRKARETQTDIFKGENDE